MQGVGFVWYIGSVQTIRRQLQRLTWLALVAMLGLALAPTVSNALSAANASAPWADICSTAEGGSSPAAPGDLGHLQHCPLCCQLAGVLGMPPADVVPLAAPGRQAQGPVPTTAVPRAPRAWAAAQPRGPPALS